MPKLNKDILFLIFEELQEDSKSLFSCLMTNRFWCEIAIPILWKNPWRYNIDYYNKNSLYSVITFYLPDDIKDFLTREEILLPILRHPLLFDYLSFCRSFDADILNAIISIRSLDLYNQFILQQEIYKLLISSKCPELKYLNIKSIKHQIFYFPKAKARLESLCELKCDTSINSSYFYGLTRICHYIQRLIIINKKISVNHGAVKLIENQKNLKYFELKDDFENDVLIEDPYKEIFLALVKKADDLNHLKIHLQYIEFYEHTIIQNLLTKFSKLKTLIISGIYIPFSKNQLKMLTYHELEIFNIDYISFSEASIIIENSGGYLREILLKYCDYEYIVFGNFDDSPNFIRKIYQNCPLIEYLSLLFSSKMENFVEFENLLKVCQNLRSLLLSIPNNDKEKTGEELLEVLIRSAPTNIREIRFFNDFKFSLNNLEKFFKNWKDRPALSILTSDPQYKRDDYIKLINKYKKNGVIKAFRCDFERNIYY
ncbi:uncharacterized protein OCT59_010111 [Rhizophagus irregularis]|uniref:F-box domain-containing protein n=2 Tax=Rhizophagus irregularis TaxID=588596 RepID=A0A015M0S5_RHIIW|nr:hypothetical protein RirG_179400 [Rhizophagus irregularis DAOM 197198w]UZO18802.1 hypothetical protein OCT59_010111 [Rhizophagus irregularis]GBC38796.1 hypothetical protein GLOIN_2v1791318 [Rhizophagus irregularis DAOM 181602=DAOM 197198]